MRKIIAANWKENKTTDECLDFVRKLKSKRMPDADILLAPSFVSIATLARKVAGTPLRICAQDVSGYSHGSYTGEVGAFMLKDYCDYVMVGHSEKRLFFGDTNVTVNDKLLISIGYGLAVILCIGENSQEKATGVTDSVLFSQLDGCLKGVTAEQMQNISIAYEPVWAISRGDMLHEPATPKDAEQAHVFIRNQLAKKFGKEVSDSTRIIYGGSVKPTNARQLFRMKNIDGLLVGSASLDSESFYAICNSSS